MGRLLALFSASLDQPRLVPVADGGQAYRYETPDVRHFCLLKGVVAINTLFAILELVRLGYIFQVNALLRIVIECTTHIEFVLDPSTEPKQKEKVAEYLAAYSTISTAIRLHPLRSLRLNKVSCTRRLEKRWTILLRTTKSVPGRKSAADAYFSVYRALSNFIHVRYPESIDLYGGRPGGYHLHGMSGTRKDMEMAVTLEPIVGTVSNVFAHMIQYLDLLRFAEADPVIGNWFRNRGRPQ